jgi:hypothetical protein
MIYLLIVAICLIISWHFFDEMYYEIEEKKSIWDAIIWVGSSVAAAYFLKLALGVLLI